MQLPSSRAAMAALAVVGALTTSALAQSSTTYYGPNGQHLGTSTTIGKTTTFYDDRGSKTGSETRLGNTSTVYDAQGRHVGSATAQAPSSFDRAFGFTHR